jgi:imidazolonepropionase
MLLTNASLAVMDGKPAYGLVDKGAQSRSRMGALPGRDLNRICLPGSVNSTRWILKAAWSRPALIDCHTHVVSRRQPGARIRDAARGRSYEEIARAGGGIVSTVRPPGRISEAELLAGALPASTR